MNSFFKYIINFFPVCNLFVVVFFSYTLSHFIRFCFLHFQNRRFRIYSIALIISAIFLAMTLAIGFLIPSNHHVLHCRCQTYYVGCLLVGDLLLAINQSYGSLITGLPCLALGKEFRLYTIAHFINFTRKKTKKKIQQLKISMKMANRYRKFVRVNIN